MNAPTVISADGAASVKFVAQFYFLNVDHRENLLK